MAELILAVCVCWQLSRLSRTDARMSLLHRLAMLWVAVGLLRLIARVIG